MEQGLAQLFLGFRLPRQMFGWLGTLFSPDTILTWHRTLVVRKYDGSAIRRLLDVCRPCWKRLPPTIGTPPPV